MNVTTSSNLDITKYNGIIIPCFEGQQPSLETLPQQTATYLKARLCSPFLFKKLLYNTYL